MTSTSTSKKPAGKDPTHRKKSQPKHSQKWHLAPQDRHSQERRGVLMQKLKDSEIRYRRLFEAAQDGILILDAKTGLIKDVNPYLIKMLGYSRKELVEKRLWEVGAFKDIEASKDAFEDLQENEYIRYEDLPLKTKDGQLIQVEFVSNAYLVGGEKVIQCIIRDTSAHNQIIAALKKKMKEYHDLVDLSPDGMFIIESSGNIQTVNSVMCNELKYSKEELLSMNIWDIIPEQYLDQYNKRLTRILNGESLIEDSTEYEVYGKDRKVHYLDLLSTPIYKEKDIIGIQGIARDITARKQMERALRIRTEDLALVNTLNEAANHGTDIDGLLKILTKGLKDMIPGCLSVSVFLLDSSAKYLELQNLTLSASLKENIENLIGRPIPNIKISIQEDSHFHKISGNEQGSITSDPKMIRQWITEFAETTFFSPLIRNQLKKLVPLIYKLLKIKSVASVPLISSGKTIGLLEVSTSESVMTEDDMKRIQNISGQVTAVILRKQAEQQIQGQIKHMEALLKIERAISSTLDYKEVLNLIMAELGKIIPCDSISLQILHDKSLEIIACRGFTQPGEVIGLVFPLDPKFPNLKVITTKEALAIDDVTQEYLHFKTQSNKYSSGNIRSWLGVPLISEESVKGMISLDRSDVIPFSEDEINLATAISGQAILAIENARLFGSSERHLTQLSSLRMIDNAISGSFDLRISTGVLLDKLLEDLEVDAAAVLQYREDIQRLEFVQGRGFKTTTLRGTDIPLGQGYAGKVGLERDHIFIPDLNQAEDKFFGSPLFLQEEFVSYYGVPLITKGILVGVLEVFHRSPLNPTDEWVNFLNSLAGQAAIAIDNITLYNDLQRSNVELKLAYDATIEGWARALELKDMETEGHSRRVVKLTMDIAREMGISGEKLIHIRRGALLHDIGKMGIPDAILQKPGKLSDEEWQIMHQHPVYTLDWLYPIEYLRPALEIPYSHHEKWDGTGYPQGIKGEQIPLAARIFAIVDVWDALTSDRPYRKAWSKEKALAYIKEESGKHFDPQVVEVFLKQIRTRD